MSKLRAMYTHVKPPYTPTFFPFHNHCVCCKALLIGNTCLSLSVSLSCQISSVGVTSIFGIIGLIADGGCASPPEGLQRRRNLTTIYIFVSLPFTLFTIVW